MFAVIRAIAVTVAMVSALGVAVAQVIPPSEMPGRERERFTQYSTAPSTPLGGITVGLPSAEPPPGAADVRLIIREVRISGVTVYRSAELAALYDDLIGRPVTLVAVYEIAKRITDKYGADGYVLSRAVILSQDIDPDGAIIRLQVIEGYVDKVVWPSVLAGYLDFFSDYSAKITRERPANLFTIERYLLLAGDLPGLIFKNRLVPSATHPGAATLIVEVTEKPVDVFVRSDNLGSQARGPYQYMASATLNNPTRFHEATRLTVAGSYQTVELSYAAVNHRRVLNSEGLSAYVFAGYGWGRPGTDFLSSIDYQTKSLVVEAGLSYPIIRTRERNLTLTGLAFASDDHGNILSAPFSLDRLRGVRLRAEADWVDPLKGVNQLFVVASQGIPGAGSTINGNPLASRLAGRVDFTKIEATFARLQSLGGGFSSFIAALGQYGFTPLLYPEVCGYGGRVFGRAFDPSQIIGDNCAEVLGELRYDLPPPGIMTQLQLYAYADRAWLHNIAPDPGIPSNVKAASAGGGLRLGWLNSVFADLYAVKALEGPRDDWRFRFILTGRY